MKDGFLKIACVTPPLRVADCTYNADQIIAKAKEAAQAGAKLAAFPELCLTGYTCGDLFLQEALLRGAEEELVRILNETADLSILVIVGLPYASNGALYNCAAVCCQGKMLGMVPKQNLPNYSEFYEARHFTPGRMPERRQRCAHSAAIRNMRFRLAQSCSFPVCFSMLFHNHYSTVHHCYTNL